MTTPTKSYKASRSGHMGGMTTLSRHGLKHLRSAGEKGGQAIVEKYGRSHFVELGRKSVEARRARKDQVLFE